MRSMELQVSRLELDNTTAASNSSHGAVKVSGLKACPRYPQLDMAVKIKACYCMIDNPYRVSSSAKFRCTRSEDYVRSRIYLLILDPLSLFCSPFSYPSMNLSYLCHPSLECRKQAEKCSCAHPSPKNVATAMLIVVQPTLACLSHPSGIHGMPKTIQPSSGAFPNADTR